VLALLGPLCGLATPLSAAQADPTVPPYEVLVSPAATPDQRLAAASEILQQPPPAVALADAVGLLTHDPTGGEAARGVLLAIAGLPQAPAAALQPTLAIARDPSSPLRTEAIRALRAFRTREAAAALVEFASESQEPAAREAALRSLARLSGRADLGTNSAAWREWLAGALALSDRQWEQELLLAHVRHSQHLETNLGESERRLVEAWRQIHLLTPIEERSAVLARLLTSDLAALRDLGFELVNREISESRVLDSTVSEAAVSLLQSPDPLVRSQAALVLNRLVPAGADTAVLAALARETDPRAAEALLLAASRWPSAGAVRPMLRWLDAPTATRLRAAALAWVLLRAGYLESPEDRAAVLDAIRSLGPESLTASASRLLVALGGSEDVARIRALLDPSVDPAVRVTAAEALSLREDQVKFLLAAAQSDPSIFEATSRAVLTHMHDAAGYTALAGLPAPSPHVRARVLTECAAVLSSAELVSLAKAASTPDEALLVLNPLTSAERLGAPADPPHLAEGLLLLSRANLELNSPAEALSALSLIPEGQTPAPAPELTDLRATLLLWLNRIDEAEDLDASPAAWLDALEHALAEPHAGAIADRLEANFSGRLTAADRARLDKLRREVADADSAPSGDGG